ncbi:helix-turn-helix domain containing protein [Mycobacterium sp. CVI_P3]|uniref:Helix-turn-helix domain containing protein n=1 Tax=Mycobacterium pinniadriaticum TaxID=2994102 RepID=A0ABT3SGM7_9MYCO|nr:helix-turn-helix domain-containing protein [Mycobacterium pinniadriaticum]MCX2932267.1 helix-turn-helix domain containing protein [Mycobacterium pinniadriaticum]MCX2938633.1 helix-turn-helix domain containing protein [Mycobacterium pinniadriaticum]
MAAGSASTGAPDVLPPRRQNKRTVGRPRGSNTDARREMILAAAVRVFAHRGYDAATLQDVADLVGVTRPAVHHHFPGKAPLYRAALDRACEIVTTAMAAQPLEAMIAPPQGQLRVACALLGTSLAQSHRIADVAPRITTVSADVRLLCTRAACPDGDEHRVDLLVNLIVGSWVMAACDLTWPDIVTDFDLC